MNSGVIQGFRTDIDFSKLGYQFFKADIYLRDYKKRGNIINYVKTNIIHFPIIILIFVFINGALILIGFIFYHDYKKR